MVSLAETTRTYQDAVDVIMQNTNLFVNLSNHLLNIFDVMESALARGFFDARLAQSISELITPYHVFSSVQTAITALGSSFEGKLKPEVYDLFQKGAMEIKKMFSLKVDRH